jgi:predicted GNAT family N-acyltransferase
MTYVIRQVAFTSPDFARCFEIRLAVFVEEQNVPIEEEHDEHDETALHFLATLDDKPAGTARVLLKHSTAKITRVAVLRAARGHGIGAALMRHIESTVPARRFTLDAQLHALPFYEHLGYVAESEVFMEAGIPHRHMAKNVP